MTKMVSVATISGRTCSDTRSTAIGTTSVTPGEYELYLKDLSERIEGYLAGGGEDADRLLRDAEDLLALADSFPDVFERHSKVEGLVAEVLARRQRERFLAPQQGASESPGCLLGWLLRGRGRTR